MPALHVIISTHTARHLATVMAGVGAQARRADRVIVSCDVEDAGIGELVRERAFALGLDATVVQRPHRGESRSAQVRNNGVRALSADGLAAGAHLVFLDGDCCPGRGCFEAHERLGAAGDLIIGFRFDLTQEQTAQFDVEAMASGRDPVAISEDQRAGLIDRDRRYRRNAIMRRFGLAKPHKPKLLSANFSISAAMYQMINGFDEEYQGYGGEDDDLGRRVYAAGGRPVIGVSEAIAYHLWHPTRAAARWEDSPGIARFKTRTPTRTRFGLDSPYDQPAPTVARFAAAGPASQPAAPIGTPP